MRILRAALLGVLAAAAPAGLRAEAGAAAYLSEAGGARWQGMGRAARAAVSDVGAMYINPAGLAAQGAVRWEVGAGCGFASLGRTAFSLSFLGQTDRAGTFAFGWVRHGVDGLERVDASGNVIGHESDAEDALTAAFGFPLIYQIRLGAAVRYLHQTLFDFSADGATLDVGARIQPWLGRELFLGLVAGNLAGTYEWNTGRRDRPARVIAGGIAYAWRTRALFAADLVSREGAERLSYHAGAEYWAVPEVAVRAGVDDGWLAAGATYHWQIYELDYGFTLDDSGLGDVHRFSFILRF